MTTYKPSIAREVFIAPGAVVVGRVKLGEYANIWYNAVLRGDVEEITVGTNTNIQDGVIGHVVSNQFGLHIGANVTVGHAAILHGCAIGDNSLIGMGSTVLDGAVVESGAMLAAGSLLTPGKTLPTGELWGGRPARFMRLLSPEEHTNISDSATHYVQLAKQYKKGMFTQVPATSMLFS